MIVFLWKCFTRTRKLFWFEAWILFELIFFYIFRIGSFFDLATPLSAMILTIRTRKRGIVRKSRRNACGNAHFDKSFHSSFRCGDFLFWSSEVAYLILQNVFWPDVSLGLSLLPSTSDNFFFFSHSSRVMFFLISLYRIYQRFGIWILLWHPLCCL